MGLPADIAKDVAISVGKNAIVSVLRDADPDRSSAVSNLIIDQLVSEPLAEQALREIAQLRKRVAALADDVEAMGRKMDWKVVLAALSSTIHLINETFDRKMAALAEVNDKDDEARRNAMLNYDKNFGGSDFYEKMTFLHHMIMGKSQSGQEQLDTRTAFEIHDLYFERELNLADPIAWFERRSAFFERFATLQRKAATLAIVRLQANASDTNDTSADIAEIEAALLRNLSAQFEAMSRTLPEDVKYFVATKRRKEILLGPLHLTEKGYAASDMVKGHFRLIDRPVQISGPNRVVHTHTAPSRLDETQWVLVPQRFSKKGVVFALMATVRRWGPRVRWPAVLTKPLPLQEGDVVGEFLGDLTGRDTFVQLAVGDQVAGPRVDPDAVRGVLERRAPGARDPYHVPGDASRQLEVTLSLVTPTKSQRAIRDKADAYAKSGKDTLFAKQRDYDSVYQISIVTDDDRDGDGLVSELHDGVFHVCTKRNAAAKNSMFSALGGGDLGLAHFGESDQAFLPMTCDLSYTPGKAQHAYYVDWTGKFRTRHKVRLNLKTLNKKVKKTLPAGSLRLFDKNRDKLAVRYAVLPTNMFESAADVTTVRPLPIDKVSSIDLPGVPDSVRRIPTGITGTGIGGTGIGGTGIGGTGIGGSGKGATLELGAKATIDTRAVGEMTYSESYDGYVTLERQVCCPTIAVPLEACTTDYRLFRQYEDEDGYSEVEHVVLHHHPDYPDHVLITEVPDAETAQKFAEDTTIVLDHIGAA